MNIYGEKKVSLARYLLVFLKVEILYFNCAWRNPEWMNNNNNKKGNCKILK